MTVRISIALLIALLAAPAALAQGRPANSGPPNAVQGFSRNKGQPVQIEASRLEVRDKDKVATFIGSVKVTQGDTNLRCKTLVVHYEGETPAASGGNGTPAAAAIPSSSDQRIKKLEARGEVVVTQNDQVATGEVAIFDMPTNMVTMSGNVVLTQGQNVLRGERLVVDMTTGFSRVESGGGNSGRVQGLFLPSSRPQAPAAGKPAGSN